jgi:hypothetical protein
MSGGGDSSLPQSCHRPRPGATAAMASQTPSELAISSVRWRQQPSAALPKATSGAGAVAAATYRELHEGATAAMASQTPSELAISSVRWRQQPSAQKYTKERPQPWRARSHRSWPSRMSGGDSSLPQPLALQRLREEMYAHSHPLAWRQNPPLLPRCKAVPGQRFTGIRLQVHRPQPCGVGAAVACSKFDDARQPSFRCLRLEPAQGPDGATVEVPTPLDPKTVIASIVCYT